MSSIRTQATRFLPYIVLLIFAAALLGPLLLGRRLYWGDILFYFDPMARWIQQSLRAGYLPLWNPYVYCGQPLVGNPQMSVFYPTSCLLPLLPVGAFLSLTSLLHLFLCGAFMYLYLQRWTKYRAASLSGGLTYMGSACLLSRLQFPPMIMSAAFWPLLLYFVDCTLDTLGPTVEATNAMNAGSKAKTLKSGRGFRARLGLMLAVSFMILAAHAQVAYFGIVLTVVYGVARLQERTSGRAMSRRARWFLMARHAAPLALTGVGGLLLASIHVFPALQLLQESSREKMTVWQANRFVVQPVQLLTLVWPGLTGHPANGNYWGGDTAWEPSLFLGWAPLPLIAIALARFRSDSWVRFWSLTSVLGIWLALGIAGKLYWVAFYVVPGIARFHDPARFLFFTNFALASLTGRGADIALDRLSMRAPGRKVYLVRSLGLLCLTVPVLVPGWDWNPTTTVDAAEQVPSSWRFLQPKRGVDGDERGRVYFPVPEVIWRRMITEGYSDYGRNDRQGLYAMLDTLHPNLSMRLGRESASGYEPVPIASLTQIDGLARASSRRGEPNVARLLDIMHVKTVILPRDLPLQDASFAFPESRVASKIRFEERIVSFPKAWLVRRTRRVEGMLRILSALSAPDFHPDEEALVSFPDGSRDVRRNAGEERTAGGFQSVSLSPRAPPVQIVSGNGHEVVMEVNTGPAAAFLVYSVTAYPGWKADVDNRPVGLMVANGAFLGIPLPPGAHRVHLLYRPEILMVGMYVTLATISILMAVCVVHILLQWRSLSGVSSNVKSAKIARF